MLYHFLSAFLILSSWHLLGLRRFWRTVWIEGLVLFALPGPPCLAGKIMFHIQRTLQALVVRFSACVEFFPVLSCLASIQSKANHCAISSITQAGGEDHSYIAYLPCIEIGTISLVF